MDLLTQVLEKRPPASGCRGEVGISLPREKKIVHPMRRVMVFYMNRAEKGLLDPVIRRLEEDPEIECTVKKPYELKGTDPGWLGNTYDWAWNAVNYGKPDLVVAPFDRVDMLMVAVAAMVSNVPVAQLHAGDVSGPGTWDDKSRYAIMSIADLVFCNGDKSWRNAVMAKRASKGESEQWDDWLSDEAIDPTLPRRGLFEVGSTALDDVELDYSLVPGNTGYLDGQLGTSTNLVDVQPVDTRFTFIQALPFDLVLYNPETATDKDEENLDRIFELFYQPENWYRGAVIIGPNGDPGSEEIRRRFISYQHHRKKPRVWYYDQVTRPQFLGLLKMATRVIGNSSSFCLELPLLREDWENVLHLVGTRNTKDRILRDSRTGGSDRIHLLIRKFLGLSVLGSAENEAEKGVSGL